jgi:hypothetical protein
MSNMKFIYSLLKVKKVIHLKRLLTMLLFFGRDLQVPVTDAVSAFKSNFATQPGDSVMVVRRSRLLATAFDAMKRPSFSIFRNFKVEFSGEEAIDVGGPRREFFRFVTVLTIV